MKTYLDMDEILRHSHTYIGKGYYDDTYLDLVSAVPEEVIRSLPPADVVAVVRCHDCKHLCVHSEALGVYQCEVHGDYPSEEYFCADGERKDGGQDDV